MADNSSQVLKLPDETLIVWSKVSYILYWIILIISLSSLPLLCRTLWIVMRHYKNHYFYPYLSVIIIGDFLMLLCIIIPLILDKYAINLTGVISCKLMAFCISTLACFVNWVWVGMFAQRFAYIFYPIMTRRCHPSDFKTLCFSIVGESYRLIFAVFLFSLTAQIWMPTLISKVPIFTRDGELVGHICGPDMNRIHPIIYKLVSLLEALVNYAIPFGLAMVADLVVLLCYNTFRKSHFKLVTIEALHGRSGQTSPNSVKDTVELEGLKILSGKSLQNYQHRRHLAIRRCLIMTTINLSLNLPYFLLQLFDNFFNLQGSDQLSIFYVYSDAIFYVLYLMQFPFVTLFVHFLKFDTEDYKKLPRNGKAMTTDSTISRQSSFRKSILFRDSSQRSNPGTLTSIISSVDLDLEINTDL